MFEKCISVFQFDTLSWVAKQPFYIGLEKEENCDSPNERLYTTSEATVK